MYISEAYSSDKFQWKEEIIGEDSSGPKKALMLEGEFQQAEKQNRNGRVYSRNLLERETNNLKTFIKERNGLIMSLDHPLPGDSDQAITLIQRMGLQEAAGLCVNLEMNGNIVYGKAKVLEGDHGAGDKIATLVRNGFKPGVSSRGIGGKPVYQAEGVVYVPEDYQMITYDWVSSPSTHNAILSQRFNEELMFYENEIKNHQKTLWSVLTDIRSKY